MMTRPMPDISIATTLRLLPLTLILLIFASVCTPTIMRLPPGDLHRPCSSNSDCSAKHGFVCNPSTAKCDCMDPMNTNSPGYGMYYSNLTSKCVSAVGKLCLVEEKSLNERFNFACVPNAHCTQVWIGSAYEPGRRWRHGICRCNNGYLETAEHMCERKFSGFHANGDDRVKNSMYWMKPEVLDSWPEHQRAFLGVGEGTARRKVEAKPVLMTFLGAVLFVLY